MSQAEIPETFFNLVSHYSPTRQEAGAVSYLVGRMQALGYEQAFVDQAGNAVGILGNGPRQVALLGHIDTVPGQIEVRVEGDFLYGRGSVDAKGPLACFVDAAVRSKPPEGWQLIVIGAVDEEGDSAGARFCISQYQPEFIIIGEPSHWDRITLGYKGSAWAKITVRRTLAHTASQAESASEAAVKLWGAVQGWVDGFNAGRPRAFDKILPTLRAIQSGGDGFEEWASLRIGARLPVGVSPEDWLSTLKELAGEASVESDGFSVSAYQAEKNTPLVRAFLAGIRSVGGSPGFLLKTGTADMNIVAPAWGCPAVAYGPGDSALDHTPNEHASIEEYRKAVEVLSFALKEVCLPPFP
jgi:[amino group carrier protein]-lysine/ornithine hydrolase